MPTESTPRALVVHESMFGNTAAVAASVADGLRRGGLAVATTSVVRERPEGPVDLLVVGAPTHAFSMSRPATREDAAKQGATGSLERGLREWLAELPAATGSPLAAVFDTRVTKVRRLPWSASRSAARELTRHGYRLLDAPQGFLVADTPGPLAAGELDRARRWGEELAGALQAGVSGGSGRARSPSSRHRRR